jgi:hypothetical protein
MKALYIAFVIVFTAFNTGCPDESNNSASVRQTNRVGRGTGHNVNGQPNGPGVNSAHNSSLSGMLQGYDDFSQKVAEFFQPYQVQDLTNISKDPLNSSDKTGVRLKARASLSGARFNCNGANQGVFTPTSGDQLTFEFWDQLGVETGNIYVITMPLVSGEVSQSPFNSFGDTVKLKFSDGQNVVLLTGRYDNQTFYGDVFFRAENKGEGYRAQFGTFYLSTYDTFGCQ